MSTRTEILLASVPRDSRIIEIGPSFNPIAPKSAGWNSASIDHLTREGLLAKYMARPDIDVSRIEPVDFVWTGGPLSDAVPPQQHGCFDVFLASHVIEHTPDLIAFLDSAATLLTHDGVVILAIPDKRYCFDYFQPLTTTGELLEAHAQRRRRHNGRHAFDHFAYAVTDGGLEAWGQRPLQELRLIHGLESSIQNARVIENNSNYEDMHAWHFIPSSFELLLLELAALGEIDWRVERITPTMGWEFCTWLRRGARAHMASLSAEELEAQRISLLKRTLLETRAQIDWLLAGQPDLATEEIGPPMKSVSAMSLSLARYEREVVELGGRLANAEAQCATVTQRIAALETSTSWRLTAPLRILLDGLRRPRTGPSGFRVSGRLGSRQAGARS